MNTLTARQTASLAELAKHACNVQAAAKALDVKPTTIYAHVERAREVLGLRGSMPAVVQAWQAMPATNGVDPSDVNPYGLTPAQCDVADCLVSGDGNEAIGRRLSKSPHTIADDMKAIFTKLGTNNRTRAAVLWDRFRRPTGKLG